jgi:hypothetical protein
MQYNPPDPTEPRAGEASLIDRPAAFPGCAV